MSRLSEVLGEFQYLRMKASWYVETIRAWVTPSAAAGAFTKYLGFETGTAILAAVLVAPVVEGVGYFLGKFMWQHGGTAREYQMSLDRDPYKLRQLALQERTLAVEREIAATLMRLRAMAERAESPAVPADLEDP